MSDSARPPLLEGVLAAVDLGIIVLDGARRVVLWNQWMSRHSGTAPAAVLGQEFGMLFPELRGRRIEGAITQALEHNFPSLLSQTLNRSPFPLFVNAAAAQREERLQQALAVTPLAVDGAPRHCMIEIHDVSIAVGREKLLRQQALELRSQSFSDGLTGVANRRHFDVAIDKELRRAKRNGSPLSLLMIDIDHFKSFNDHYGHQRGDECLVRVASALSGMLQRAADLIARYGGEEFVLILPDTNEEQAAQMAQAIRARVIALGIPHAASSLELKQVTVSIGAATRTPTHPAEAQELIGAADRALYDAKRAGRNRVATQLPA